MAKLLKMDRKSPQYSKAFEKAVIISHDPVQHLQIPAQGEEEKEVEFLKKQLAEKKNQNNTSDGKQEMIAAPINTDELDLVFAIDTTSSMGSYISIAKEKIVEIIENITTKSNVKVRFGIVAWRDLPPQDSTFITKVYDFTDAKDKALSNVKQLSPHGGGDGPEAVADAIYESWKMPWKQGIMKIVIFIADAPPHGLPNASGDGLPPKWDQHDPIAIAKTMAKEQITIYSVGCLPALSGYQHAADVRHVIM